MELDSDNSTHLNKTIKKIMKNRGDKQKCEHSFKIHEIKTWWAAEAVLYCENCGDWERVI